MPSFFADQYFLVVFFFLGGELGAQPGAGLATRRQPIQLGLVKDAQSWL
jgi:hypothetical protein